MTEQVAVKSVQFVRGQPDFEFDQCYRCFEGKDMLFRLVNTEKSMWAFHNDTTETVVKVRAIFKAGSNVQPLQRTRLRAIPKPDGTVDTECEQEATVEVAPGKTEQFIEGVPSGYNLFFQSEAAPSENIQFENVRPSVPYDKIYKCFKNNGNGLLFRLVDDSEKKWFFYNDTKDYNMKVSVDFADKDEVAPLGTTRASPSPASSKGVICVLEIPPGTTLPFIHGAPSAYKLDFAAEPVVSGDREEAVTYANGQPDATIIPNQTHVYKCFKEHGNGLLFRIVDDVNHIWAFYNDTLDYVMTVNVRFPAGTNVQLAPSVETMADDTVPGGFVSAIRVPPVSTVPFLVGQPATFDLAFTANAAVAKAQPLIDAEFENGGPNKAVMEYQEIYKCFKEHGNGLLFRLVDVQNQRWGFYNDTANNIMTVKVSFAANAQIKILGKTVTEPNPEGGILYVLTVEPRQTELFVEGDVGVFTTKFTATTVAPA